jgi:nucleolar GTP-binding protein
MAFQEIKPVETADRYLDMAISKAKKKTRQMKVTGKRFEKIKTLELTKLQIVRDVLASKLDEILHTFPQVKELSVFYQKLVEYTIGRNNLTKELSKVNFARGKIDELFKKYVKELKMVKEIKPKQKRPLFDKQSFQNKFNKIKKAFYGRISSVMKTPNYRELQKIRRILQSFPIIKQRYKQVAIAGFPNVGKSTLLSKLSGSRPEIAAYAFTTKGIMIGYMDGVQLLDTPGTLNRFNKMNSIEQQAYLVMKLVAEKIIYVFDLTEPYPIEDQVKLYKRVLTFGKPVIAYLSKTDILPAEEVEEFSKKFKVVVDVKELKKSIS